MIECIGFCPPVGSGGWSSANAPQNCIANVNVGGAGMLSKPAVTRRLRVPVDVVRLLQRSREPAHRATLDGDLPRAGRLPDDARVDGHVALLPRTFVLAVS